MPESPRRGQPGTRPDKITPREHAVLEILAKGEEPTGIRLAQIMISEYGIDTSPAGAHMTAASLVRKGMTSRKGEAGYRRRYAITNKGREALPAARKERQS